MTRGVLTGGSGKVGRATVKELLEHGYEVWNLDVAPPREELSGFTRIDSTDFGQVVEAFLDIDGGYQDVDYDTRIRMEDTLLLPNRPTRPQQRRTCPTSQPRPRARISSA